jgi:hypothetical protein
VSSRCALVRPRVETLVGRDKKVLKLGHDLSCT